MNIILDIILIIPLLWALWAGFRSGIVVQLGGLAGLALGVWLGLRYGEPLGRWLGMGPESDVIVGFAIIMLLVLLSVALLSRLLRGVFRFAGVATLDRLCGALLSLLKVALILGLLLYGFTYLNRSVNWVEQRKLEASVLYRPLTDTADFIFPFIGKAWDKAFGA